MIIANPIYDVVFKQMMQNERVAKFFIATLLSETVVSVQVRPQEFTYVDRLAGIAVFRLDFVATIQTEEGKHKKILIEIQKAKNQIDLMRFRNYLAEQYKKEDTVNKIKEALPITTIYILGFKLPEIKTACIKVERNYIDLINQITLTEKSDFVEKLTHDSYVVQVERITNKYQSTLDKLLSVFEQSHFIDETKLIKEFKHQTDVEELKILTDILHHSGVDPQARKLIEAEREAWRTLNAMVTDKQREALAQLSQTQKTLQETKEELNEKDKEISEKDKIIEALKQQLKDK